MKDSNQLITMHHNKGKPSVWNRHCLGWGCQISCLNVQAHNGLASSVNLGNDTQTSKPHSLKIYSISAQCIDDQSGYD